MTGSRYDEPVIEPGPDDDTPKEACGVFGVFAPAQPVSHLTYLGLYALQHRGQEAAGMAVSDGSTVTVVKETGLVSNTDDLAGEVGMLPGSFSSDSDVMTELIAMELAKNPEESHDHRALERAVLAVMPQLRGAFSIVAMDEGHVIGVRDPNGFRPLCLGRLPTGWVLASESPALDVVGAHFVRELEPGEMIIIDETGYRSVRAFAPELVDPKLCLFEFVYFARPDTRLYGQSVHQARVRMGEQLAEQSPVEADMVMGVPESGIPAAEGYALRSGIPFGQGLVKNRYIGRTFIAPNQEMRALGVRMKLNPLRDNIAGRRLIVVDDSIVRGTTTRAMVAMLREAGAAEVHMRISSPPYKWPCFYGMDTGTRGELLAANMSVDEIREYLNVDTLSYLALDRLLDATGAVGAGFCDACLTGTYPVAIPEALTERVVELPTKADSRFSPVASQFAEFLDVDTSLPAADGAVTLNENE